MKYILINLLMIVVNPILSQDNISPKIQINGISTDSYIETKFLENFDSKLSDIGQLGSCLVKFKLTPENKVKDIEISGINNYILLEFITDILMESSGLWSLSADLTEGLQDLNFLLPITYVLQKDGKAEKIVNDDSTFLSVISSVRQTPQKIIVLPQINYISPFKHSPGRGRLKTNL